MDTIRELLDQVARSSQKPVRRSATALADQDVLAVLGELEAPVRPIRTTSLARLVAGVGDGFDIRFKGFSVPRRWGKPPSSPTVVR